MHWNNGIKLLKYDENLKQCINDRKLMICKMGTDDLKFLYLCCCVTGTNPSTTDAGQVSEHVRPGDH